VNQRPHPDGDDGEQRETEVVHPDSSGKANAWPTLDDEAVDQ